MADSKKQAYTFIPRCINYKKSTKGKHKKTKNLLFASSHEEENTESNDSSDEVKKFSLQQRWPAADEPVCVICKKFGEYICDETDEDVCSLECKETHLREVKSPPTQNANEQEEPTCQQLCFDSYYGPLVVYSPHKDIHSMSEEKMKVFREKLEIRIKGASIPKLILDFKQCSFPPLLLENMKENDFVSPTPVQMQVIPSILSGNDVLVSACTSSGKTASFVLPIIRNIYNCLCDLPSFHEFCMHPIALILTPTRELAIQIEEIIKLFGKSLVNLKTALLIGGVPLPPQLHRLKHKIQIVIGTPGRINDILQNHDDSLQLKQIKMVVLDEVDVMLQMGFQNQIHSVVEQIPCKPQYMMFSATIPSSIENLASRMMTNSVFISVGAPGLPNKSIKQIVLWVEDVSKKKKLFSIIEDSKHFLPPALVFVDSKVGADMLSEAVSKKYSLHCESIHSDKSQSERSKIMRDFHAGVYDILVSTNVMGRGIDLLNVRQVILFDMPASIEDYVHQVGRAGGLHANGFVISFVNNSNKKIFLDLKALFDTTDNKLPDQLIYSPHLKIESEKRESKKKKSKGSDSSSWKDEDVNPQNLLQILTKNRRPNF